MPPRRSSVVLAALALVACDASPPRQGCDPACAVSGLEPIAYAYLDDDEHGHRGHGRELVLDGDLAFVADSNGLPSLVWDSTGALTLLQGIDPARHVHCSSIALHAPSRTLLCTAGDGGGLVALVDVRDPAAPVTRPWPRADGSLPLTVPDVAVAGDTAWLAATEHGLLRATLEADGTPSPEEATGVGTEVVQVEVMGDRLIVLDRTEGLLVIDAATLAPLGRAPLAGPPLDLAVDGDRAVVSLGSEGSAVFRIDDAGQPQHVVSVQPRCVAVASDLDGDTLAVGCLSGVTVFDLAAAPRVFGFVPSRFGVLDVAFAEYGLVVVDWVRVDVYAVDPAGSVVVPDVPRTMRLAPGADARIPLRNPGDEPLVVEWSLHGDGAGPGESGTLTLAPGGDALLELSHAPLVAIGSADNRADVVFVREGDVPRFDDEQQLAPHTRIWHRRPEDDPTAGRVAIGEVFPTLQRSATGAGPETLPTPGVSSLVMFLTVDCFLQWPQLEDMAWASANRAGAPTPIVFFLTTWDEDPFDPSGFMRSFAAESLLTVEWADYLRSIPGGGDYPNPVTGFESTFMMRTPGADFPHDYLLDESGTVIGTSRMFRGGWRLGE